MNVAYFNFGFWIADFGLADCFLLQSKIQNLKSKISLLSSSVLHDHVRRAFVPPRLVAACRLSPRGHRVAAAGGFTFTAAVRVIDRVHRDAADLRTLAHPA